MCCAATCHWLDPALRTIAINSDAADQYRYRVKPGMTGWAQVNGLRGEVHRLEEAKDAHDIYNVKNWSLWLDLKILLKTLFAVLDTRD